ncbi:MAG: hypothetical protein ACOVP4_11230 [Bacteriovoracaceae bacterium]
MKFKIPFLLSIVAIIGGVFISILFGADESIFKNRIAQGLEKNIKIQSIVDADKKAEKIKSEQDKNWRYYQRYHFHANGIASLSLAMLILLAFIKASKKEILVASYMIAVGGFLYPFVWLFAALYGPEIGRDEAKEAFAIFGYMGGLYLLGIIYGLYLAAARDWRAPLIFSEN